MKEPKFRCGTGKAIAELAIELDLQNQSWMQDWSYQVANTTDLIKYINHYNLTEDEDKKFVLMEMIIQATNDQDNQEDLNRSWRLIEPLLIKDFKIHDYTIFYWSNFDNVDPKETFAITHKLREFWETSTNKDL